MNYDLFCFNSKKQGELDFVVEHQGEVLPIEVKSGKDYEHMNQSCGGLEEGMNDDSKTFCIFAPVSIKQSTNEQVRDSISDGMHSSIWTTLCYDETGCFSLPS